MTLDETRRTLYELLDQLLERGPAHEHQVVLLYARFEAARCGVGPLQLYPGHLEAAGKAVLRYPATTERPPRLAGK